MPTKVTIKGEDVLVSGGEGGASARKGPVREGRLLGLDVWQAIFDDEAGEAQQLWRYPDTGVWNPERNTRELSEALPYWHDCGVNALRLGMQGGAVPGGKLGLSLENSAFNPNGTLKFEYVRRLGTVLRRADQLGMAVVVTLFTPEQTARMEGDNALVLATDAATRWLCMSDFRNVLVQVLDQDPVHYAHEMLQAANLPKLMKIVRDVSGSMSRPMPVGTCCRVQGEWDATLVRAGDFVAVEPSVLEGVSAGVLAVALREMSGGKPLLCACETPAGAAFSQERFERLCEAGFSVFYGEQGVGDYSSGFHTPPVNWQAVTPSKQAFADFLRQTR